MGKVRTKSGWLGDEVGTWVSYDDYKQLEAQVERVRPYLFHTPDCDMSIAHDLRGTAPHGCNCGLIEFQAALKGEG